MAPWPRVGTVTGAFRLLVTRRLCVLSSFCPSAWASLTPRPRWGPVICSPARGNCAASVFSCLMISKYFFSVGLPVGSKAPGAPSTVCVAQRSSSSFPGPAGGVSSVCRCGLLVTPSARHSIRGIWTLYEEREARHMLPAFLGSVSGGGSWGQGF